jgi:hypothetical protein
MSAETRARKFVRQGAMSAALLLAAGCSTTLAVMPACADALTAAACDNAPKPGAEYLSDRCGWSALETRTDDADRQREQGPPHDQVSRTDQ